MTIVNDSELWLDVPEFVGYEVSDLGRIRRKYQKLGRKPSGEDGCLKPWRSKKGYMTVDLSGKSRLVHCLVMLAFVGEKPEGYEVNHKDGNKGNNQLDNLEYVTPKDNVKHAYSLGLRRHNNAARGERCARSVLTREIVLWVRRQIAGGRTSRSVAAEIGVTTSCVDHVRYRRAWKHI